MKIDQYKCKKCQAEFEELSINNDAKCPSCGKSDLEKTGSKEIEGCGGGCGSCGGGCSK